MEQKCLLAVYAYPDDEITTCITLSDREYAAKVEILRAHRTQISPTAYWLRMADELCPARGRGALCAALSPWGTDQSECNRPVRRGAPVASMAGA